MADVKHTLPPGYRACDSGHVVTMRGSTEGSERWLSEHDHRGYPSVRVSMPDGTRERRMVHQVICHAFNGPRPTPGHEVCHVDGNRKNSAPGNLRWGTRKENAEDRARHGRTSHGAAHSAAIRASNQAAGTRAFRFAQRAARATEGSV